MSGRSGNNNGSRRSGGSGSSGGSTRKRTRPPFAWEDEWAFPSQLTTGGWNDYWGSKRYKRDLKKQETRTITDGPQLTRQQKRLSVPMPVQAEILMDMPAPPHKVQSEHAWNPQDKSPNVFIKESDEFTLQRYPVANSTDGIRSKVGYESGVHLFEIFWPQGQRGTNAVIGVCTSDAPLYGNGNYHDLVGSNPSTWGWDVTRGKVYHNKMGAVYPSGLRKNEFLHVPDKFYAVLDMDAGSLGFIVKGKWLGAAFHGLKGKKLHLGVSAVWGNAQITMKYRGGLEPQPLPLMALARHAIRKGVNHQRILMGRLQELPLPNMLIDYIDYSAERELSHE